MSMSVGGCGSSGQTQTTQQTQQSGGIQQLMQALFSQADGDGNGSISSSEFSSLMNQTNGAGAASAGNTSDLFKSIDSDGDGQISLAEFKKFAGGMFAAQVGAAGSVSSGGLGGVLGKMAHAAEDLFESVFGDGSTLPPGTTVSASVFGAIMQDGRLVMAGASVSETTATLTNAATGQVVGSGGSTQTAQLASALQSYGSHHHHHGGGGLAQLLAQLTGSDDGSDQSIAGTTADSGTSATDTSVAASATGGIIIGAPAA